ncbi:MAG: DUF2927 domain-containing protein [Pseudomonadota bacterium]
MRVLLVLALLGLSACVDTKKSDLDDWTFQTKLAGGMRLDRKPADAPVDAGLLVENFRRIAFDLEPDPFGTGAEVPEDERPPMLRRWEEQIRLQIIAASGTKAGVRREIYGFMDHLSKITGIGFKPSNDFLVNAEREDPPNIFVILGDGAEFDEVIKMLEFERDGEDQRSVYDALGEFLKIWHLSYSPCAGQSYTEHDAKGERGRIQFGIVVIRTDLRAPMTESCIEEELAQTMGLMNDHPDVRPSLFNDDEEFALMTEHDELLLRILYDDRLKPGMTPEQAMPIVRQIARELKPGA